MNDKNPQPDPVAVHPAADVWPMMEPDELARMAESIAIMGLIRPVVLTPDGLVLDGKNRLAACALAGVEPTFTTYDGDPLAFVLSMNDQRRHMRTGALAAVEALMLAQDGKRKNGRWERNSITQDPDTSPGTWTEAMRKAGHVLDVLPELLRAVADGHLALDDAARRADVVEQERREREAMVIELQRDAPDLWTLVKEELIELESAWAACRVRTREERERREAERTERVAQYASVFEPVYQFAKALPDASVEATREWLALFRDDPAILAGRYRPTRDSLASARAYLAVIEAALFEAGA